MFSIKLNINILILSVTTVCMTPYLIVYHMSYDWCEMIIDMTSSLIYIEHRTYLYDSWKSIKDFNTFRKYGNFFCISTAYMTPYDTNGSPAFALFSLTRSRSSNDTVGSIDILSISTELHSVTQYTVSFVHSSTFRDDDQRPTLWRNALPKLHWNSRRLGHPILLTNRFGFWFFYFGQKVLHILHKLTQIRGRVFQFI